MADSLPTRIGARLREKVQGLFNGAGFFAQVLGATVVFFRRSQAGLKVLVMQILFTGVEALGIIMVLSLALGAIISSQGFVLLPMVGQSDLLYTLLVVIITRELGPILTAFIIIARSGTAIATELGGMVVSHEIEAYESFGIDPISYLVVPRFLGVVLSLLLLTVYFNFFGLVGSWLLAVIITPIPFQEYMEKILKALTIKDIIFGLAKAAIFGTIISLVASYQGFQVQRASTEVPQAGIKAVSKCFMYTILANVLLTLMYYI